MNATKWPSLTEFAKYLGREGICRVEENEKGLHIAWIDTSPEALKRQEALRRKELQDKGDEELEQRMLKEQIRRAQKDADGRGAAHAGGDAEAEEDRGLHRQEGEKVTLSFGKKPAPTEEKRPASPDKAGKAEEGGTADASLVEKQADKPLSLKMTAKPQTKNVFAQAKKNALAGGSKKAMAEQPKKMSEAERIMREEMERKRGRDFSGGGAAAKRQKM